MKKIFLRLTLIALLSLLFSFNVSATEYDRQAGYLNRLGIIQGNKGDFQLERTPTRLEAAVTIVKLLSAEKKVKSNHYQHPFIDVPRWADSYVGYLYQKGVIKGANSRFFDSFLDCDETMFLTMLLRALGYTDKNNSFGGMNAEELAADVGMLNESITYEMKNKSFLRGQMAALTFEALLCPIQNDKKTLLDVCEAVNGKTQTSTEIRKLFEVYHKAETALSKTAELIECETKSSYSLNLSSANVDYLKNETLKRQMNNGLPEVFFQSEYNEAGKTEWSKIYYQNETAYVSNSKGERVKTKKEIDLLFPKDESRRKLLFGAGQIKSYSESDDGDYMNIKLTIDGSAYIGKLNVQKIGMEAKGEKIFGDFTVTFRINQKDLIEEQSLSFDFICVSDDHKNYCIYKENKTTKTEDLEPIQFPSFKGYKNEAV
ncbi:MAG: hypothetical protein N2Z65_05335 [Clostridiales bacterium]|nr:hypothetical protein [Clostridiales bacterium]